jgi:hypothetical protein
MLGTPYQTKLTFLANLLTFLRTLLQWKLDYDNTALRSPVTTPLTRAVTGLLRSPVTAALTGR